jgi:glutathione synthase/RimK-type ligase-like ATP-grasp enzyme
MKRFARVRTANFTAKPLRKSILTDFKAIVRLGSLTKTERIFGRIPGIIEINTIDAIQNSRSKLRMKECFKQLKVPQAEWWDSIQALGQDTNNLPYPLVVKRVFGFQGRGMELINNQKELNAWINKHRNFDGWYFEKFYNYAREYRLHVAKDIGVFLSWRKLRTKDAKERWFFNSINSNWVGEDHKLFDRPRCWKEMEKAACNCVNSTGLDIGAVDIRVQSNTQRDPKFIVCEINSAPALGDLGIIKYKEVITKLINNKGYA